MSMPKFKIRYLRSAEDDLYGITDYISEDNPRAADSMIDRLEQAINRLELSPFAGKVPDDDELRKRNYRMLIVGKYLVFYKVKEKAVEIHRIIHGARDYKHLLL
jgi:addiction module RelE/StbE family toxin